MSPDGKKITIGLEDGSVSLFNLDPKLKRESPDQLVLKESWHKGTNHHASRVTCVKFSPDSQLIATASQDRTACIMNVASGKLTWRIDGMQKGVVASAQWHPDGSQLVMASWNKTVWTVKLPVFKPERLLFTHKNHVRCVAWQGKWMVSSSRDGTTKNLKWDGAVESLEKSLSEGPLTQSITTDDALEQVYCVAFKPPETSEDDTSEVAMSTWAGTIKLVRLLLKNNEEKELWSSNFQRHGHQGGIYCLTWRVPNYPHPTHHYLASGSESRQVSVQRYKVGSNEHVSGGSDEDSDDSDDSDAREALMKKRGLVGKISVIASAAPCASCAARKVRPNFVAKGHKMMCSGSEHLPEEQVKPQGSWRVSSAVSTTHVKPQGSWRERRPHFSKLEQKSEENEAENETEKDEPIGAVTALAWSPNDKGDSMQLAVGTSSSYMLVVNVIDTENTQTPEFEKLKLVRNLSLPEDAGVQAVTWSADGSRLAAGCLDNSITIWTTDDWKKAWTGKYDGPVYAVAWSPDSTLLACGGTTVSGFGQVRVLDVSDRSADPRPVWNIEDDARMIRMMKASGESEDEGEDEGNDQEQADYSMSDCRIENSVRSVVWSTDGDSLAIGSEDNTVRVVHVRKPLQRLLDLLRDFNSNDLHVPDCAISLAEWAVAGSTQTSLLTRLASGPRDPEPGWTFFHEIADSGTVEGNNDPTRLNMWRRLGEHCKDNGNVYHAIRCYGESALDIAIQRKGIDGTMFLCSHLDTDWPSTCGRLKDTKSVTRSLCLVAEHIPRHMTKVLKQLEDRGFAVRDQRSINLVTELVESRLVRPCQDDGAWEDPWEDVEVDPQDLEGCADAFECACTLKILALHGMAGAFSPITDLEDHDIERSPYHVLVNECPDELQDELFDLESIIILTEFKWETFARTLHIQRLLLYLLHFLLTVLSLVWTTQMDIASSSSSASGASGSGQASAEDTISQDFTAVLMGWMLLGNTAVLSAEVTQITQYGWEYCLSPWNWLDLIGVVALYASGIAHWTVAVVGLRYIGAVGVLANSFALLQILSPFDVTGPVIKMTAAMLVNEDVTGFLYVAGVLLVGFSAAFSISMPESDQFGISWDQAGGPFRGVLIVFQSMLGAFDLGDYEHPEAIVMFVVFAMIMVVVMLNLLIAMMGSSYEEVK